MATQQRVAPTKFAGVLGVVGARPIALPITAWRACIRATVYATLVIQGCIPVTE